MIRCSSTTKWLKALWYNHWNVDKDTEIASRKSHMMTREMFPWIAWFNPSQECLTI